jgi:uncharacterized protein with HEPN domain
VTRDVRILLRDVLEGIELIEAYVGALSAAEFAEDRKGQDAVLLRRQVIGQAVKSLPNDFRTARLRAAHIL